jgi:hypothetical protein
MPISILPDVFQHLHLPGAAGVPLTDSYDDLAGHLAGGPVPRSAVAIPNGTPIVVIDDAATVLRVAVAGGIHRRLQGWVPAAWVRTSPAYAKVA